MSDYDFRNPDDPLRQDLGYDPNVPRGTAWGWIAAAVFVAIVLAVVFGMGHQRGQNGTNIAANETRPPATLMAPPAGTPTPAPATPAAPVTPAPSGPAPQH